MRRLTFLSRTLLVASLSVGLSACTRPPSESGESGELDPEDDPNDPWNPGPSGGPGGPDGPDDPDDPDGPGGPDDLDPHQLHYFDDCEAMNQFIYEHGAELLTPQDDPEDWDSGEAGGWDGDDGGGGFTGGGDEGGGDFGGDGDGDGDGAGGDSGGAGGGNGEDPDFSMTNVQEDGVDELDRIKTDGKRILLVGEKELRYFDVESSAGTPRDTLLLDSYTQGHQIFMSGDRVMVVSRGTLAAAELWEGGLWEGNDQAPLTRIELVDISDPEHLQSVRTIFVDGDYVSARLIEDQVRLVLRTHPFSTFEFATADDFYDYGQLDWPGKELGFPKVNDWTEANEVASKYNEYLIQNSSAEDWLPQYTLQDGGDTSSGLLYGCQDTARPGIASGLDLLSVVTLDMEAGGSNVHQGGTGIFSTGETVYASRENIYVATRPFSAPGAQNPVSYVHKFQAEADDPVIYRATAPVEGRLLSQWSMSEYEGDLRVATTGDWDQQSFVSVLREEDGKFSMVGRVSGIGYGEEIYAVRFMGPVGYVVTFQQTDPLYTVDLHDPEDPKLRGELHINGYSAYLHPISDELLIGVGQDGTEWGDLTGAQISLFDVSDLTQPTRIHQYNFSNYSYSSIEQNHHAFLYWPAKNLLSIPVEHTYDASVEDGPGGATELFEVTAADGFDHLDSIRHPSTSGYTPAIHNTVVVSEVLYTLSDDGLMASDLDGSFGILPIKWLPFD